jgi:hypothetical protein
VEAYKEELLKENVKFEEMKKQLRRQIRDK